MREKFSPHGWSVRLSCQDMCEAQLIIVNSLDAFTETIVPGMFICGVAKKDELGHILLKKIIRYQAGLASMTKLFSNPNYFLGS